MSPAYSLDPEAVFSWVGIIMYLPQDAEQRELVTKAFRKYSMSMNLLADQYGGQTHWAKIELPEKFSGSGNSSSSQSCVYEDELNALRDRLSRKFPIDSFNECRAALDPENVLANHLIDELFASPRVAQSRADQY
jgi:L-galactono-1,4-lactone dehydrogenase